MKLSSVFLIAAMIGTAFEEADTAPGTSEPRSTFWAVSEEAASVKTTANPPAKAKDVKKKPPSKQPGEVCQCTPEPASKTKDVTKKPPSKPPGKRTHSVETTANPSAKTKDVTKVPPSEPPAKTKSEEKFICKAAGDFPDPKDCQIIHKCPYAGSPSFPIACPPGTIFDTVCKWPYQSTRSGCA